MNTENLKPAETTDPGTGGTTTRENLTELGPPITHLKSILVPLEFSEMSYKALQYAVPFAKHFGAKLTLLHVVEPRGYTPELPDPGPLDPKRRAAAEQQLEEIRSTRLPSGLQVETAIRHNFALDGVLDVAREIRADLIITTTHGYTGLKHAFLGSTAEKIVQKAPCPVLTVRECEHDFL